MGTVRTAPRQGRLGFSLVEASVSIGVLSFGFLALAPLLGLGLNSARQSRDSQMAAQIARDLAAEAREGTLTVGGGYCDSVGAPCPEPGACFLTQSTETALAGNCTRLTIVVTPVDAPSRPLSYAVVLPPQ
jgi:type II secretory pathway pseudopilin PulG